MVWTRVRLDYCQTKFKIRMVRTRVRLDYCQTKFKYFTSTILLVHEQFNSFTSLPSSFSIFWFSYFICILNKKIFYYNSLLFLSKIFVRISPAELFKEQHILLDILFQILGFQSIQNTTYSGLLHSDPIPTTSIISRGL